MLALVSAQRGEIGLGLGYATRANRTCRGPRGGTEVGFLLRVYFRPPAATWRATPARRCGFSAATKTNWLEDIRYPAVVVTLSMYYCKLLLDKPALRSPPACGQSRGPASPQPRSPR